MAEQDQDRLSNIDEVRQKSDEEIREDLARMREEFFLRRFSSDPKRIDNPGRFKEMRRQIARCLTVLRERELKRESESGGSEKGEG